MTINEKEVEEAMRWCECNFSVGYTRTLVAEVRRLRALTTVTMAKLELRAEVFRDLETNCRDIANKCVLSDLPKEICDYEIGKADAYRICADTLRHVLGMPPFKNPEIDQKL